MASVSLPPISTVVSSMHNPVAVPTKKRIHEQMQTIPNNTQAYQAEQASSSNAIDSSDDLKKKHKHPKLQAQPNAKSKSNARTSPTRTEEEPMITVNNIEAPNTIPAPSPRKSVTASPPHSSSMVDQDPLQLKAKSPAAKPQYQPLPRPVIPPVVHHEPPKPQFQFTDDTQKQQAKKQAVQQANSRYGQYTTTDSSYFNFIIPCLPNLNPESKKELEE